MTALSPWLGHSMLGFSYECNKIQREWTTDRLTMPQEFSVLIRTGPERQTNIARVEPMFPAPCVQHEKRQ